MLYNSDIQYRFFRYCFQLLILEHGSCATTTRSKFFFGVHGLLSCGPRKHERRRMTVIRCVGPVDFYFSLPGNIYKYRLYGTVYIFPRWFHSTVGCGYVCHKKHSQTADGSQHCRAPIVCWFFLPAPKNIPQRPIFKKALQKQKRGSLPLKSQQQQQ